MKGKDLIKALTNANGISGFEKDVVSVAVGYLEGTKLDLGHGGLGNFYIKRPIDAHSDKPVLLLDGHSDELGFMVQSITAKGMLRVVPTGSWDPRNIPAHKVRVLTDSGHAVGVFASKPPHFMTDEEKKQGIKLEDLRVDVGACSYEEATEIFGIRLGAPIIPDVHFEMLSDEIMMAKAFDNRLGCALTLELMRFFEDTPLNIQLVGAMSTQEEVGGRGAKITAFDLKPQAAIVFEGTPSDDGFVDPLEIQGGVNKGPQIRHRDNQMISNPAFTRFAIDLAKEKAIPFQEAVRTGGSTNGAVYHVANQGAPSIVIGVPVRYAHTHYCIASLKDYQNAFEWAKALILKLSAEDLNAF